MDTTWSTGDFTALIDVFIYMKINCRRKTKIQFWLPYYVLIFWFPKMSWHIAIKFIQLWSQSFTWVFFHSQIFRNNTKTKFETASIRQNWTIWKQTHTTWFWQKLRLVFQICHRTWIIFSELESVISQLFSTLLQ